MNGAPRGKTRSVMELYIVYILVFLKAVAGWVLWFCSIVWCRCTECSLPLTQLPVPGLQSLVFLCKLSPPQIPWPRAALSSHPCPRQVPEWGAVGFGEVLSVAPSPTARAGREESRAACQWHIVMCNHSNLSRFGEITMNLSVDPFILDWGGWVCREGYWTKLKWK